MNRNLLIAFLGIIVVTLLLTAAVIFFRNPSSSLPSVLDKKAADLSVDTQQVVIIKNMAFHPSTLTVKAGAHVVWQNEDTVEHSATSDTNQFDTGLMSGSEKADLVFKTPGTYTYHCSKHPDMKATIIVQ